MQVKENSENKNGYFSAGSVPWPGSSHSPKNSCAGTVQKMVQGWDKVAKASSAAA